MKSYAERKGLTPVTKLPRLATETAMIRIEVTGGVANYSYCCPNCGHVINDTHVTTEVNTWRCYCGCRMTLPVVELIDHDNEKRG